MSMQEALQSLKAACEALRKARIERDAALDSLEDTKRWALAKMRERNQL